MHFILLAMLLFIKIFWHKKQTAHLFTKYLLEMCYLCICQQSVWDLAWAKDKAQRSGSSKVWGHNGCVDFIAIILFTQQVFQFQFLLLLFCFALVPFDTWNCYYFKSKLSLLIHKNVVDKKACNIAL